MLESKAYQIYYAFASGEKAPKPKYIQKKVDSDISPKKKPVKATKGTRLKSKAKVAKPDKKKQPTKKKKAKGLAVLSEVALTEAEKLKLATKRSKKDYHMSHASGSGDGVDTQSKVPDEQQQKSSGTDEGTGTIPGVPDVPIYKSKSEKESWDDSEDEDEDDENDSNDISDEGDEDNDGNNDNDGDDDDANDDDKQEGNDTNDDDEETNSDRTKSDRIKIPILDQSTMEFYEEEKEENIDDEETMYDDEDDEVTKELYEDVNVNLGNEYTEMTNADQVHDTQKADEPVQSSSVSIDFTRKLLNLENPSLANNEIASLMETSARLAMVVPKNTSSFTTTIPLPPLFFSPLLQQATPTPTPTTSKATTSLPVLLDFASVFKFNERVFNLEKDMSEIKQVDQYAQALSSIPTIVDHDMNNKLGEAINKAILTHNLDCKQKAQDEKNAYIEIIDISMRALIKEEVNTQLPQILQQAVLDFANHRHHSSRVEIKTKIKTPPLDQTEGRKEGNRVKMLSPLEIQEDPSYTVEDSGMKQDQEFVMGDNDEQPADKEVTKADWFKKPEQPLTLDPDWSKRQQVDIRPPQTWISQVTNAEEPPTSFDELNDTSFDFSAFVLNRLKILNLTQEILVGPTFNLLKGTCKSITELKYHLEECSKATTERLD
ncbi:hypothetical protein Tco_1354438 [Tanacetum coccineum]